MFVVCQFGNLDFNDAQPIRKVDPSTEQSDRPRMVKVL